jgi:hypothetical protein
MTVTLEDAEAAESLANAICGCATREQRKNDTRALLAYAEQAAAAERAKVVNWLALPETWRDAVNCTMSMSNGDAARMAKWYSDRIVALAHLQESKP